MAIETKRRVVITGLGAIAPNGIGTEAFWHATSKGISGVKRLRHSHSSPHGSIRVAGSIDDFVAENYLERKLVNRTDRMTHFAFAAIQEALYNAQLNLEQENPSRIGAVIANTMGGVDFVLRQLQALYMRGPRFMSAYTAIAWLHVANVGQTAIRYGLQGYCKTPVNDTVGGLDALGMAAGAIRRGAADVIITGGCEAFLHPFILLVLAHQARCVLQDDPNAYRPFDRRAAGLILAEGAGMCILEEYEHARRRGAPIYGEIVGYGQTNDAHGLTAPSSNGTRYARAINLAMQEGDILPQDVAYFSLDGRAIPSSDQGEAAALHLAFGNDLAHIPFSVPRTSIGHSYAAAGVLDTIIALLALKHQLVPPTINCEELNPHYQLQLVRDEARTLRQPVSDQQAVLIGGRGIGGTNVALAIKKVV
ncbi:MAG TPA: beta-ketoacyl-[acyl-carrier-protein] synthase family protein [Ktedonobacteraceae bacterium]|nr:beta-ketoacyl-[acyl-carrier-protein] synthase family protein [Ktedonobacteraceae bacterium]